MPGRRDGGGAILHLYWKKINYWSIQLKFSLILFTQFTVCLYFNMVRCWKWCLFVVQTLNDHPSKTLLRENLHSLNDLSNFQKLQKFFFRAEANQNRHSNHKLKIENIVSGSEWLAPGIWLSQLNWWQIEQYRSELFNNFPTKSLN